MRRGCTLALGATLLLARANDGGRGPFSAAAAAPPRQPTRDVTSARPRAATPASAPTSAGTISQAEIDALLARWVGAQNGGDFASYSGLYAAKVEGIRRSGPRVRRFDRKGWLGDRRRMFARTMVVKIADLQRTAGRGSATVRLTQTFVSGSYRDVGPKLLVLVRQGGRLVIAREEMLQSTLVKADAGAEPSVASFAHVVNDGDRRLVIVGEARDDELFFGPPVLGKGDGEIESAWRAVAGKLVPEAVRRLIGQQVVLYRGHAPVCRGVLGDPVGLARADLHFSTTQQWVAEETPNAQRAQEIWSVTGQDHHLALRVTTERPCADRADWARLASLPLPFAAAAQDAPEPLAQRARAALQGLPRYQQLQREYQETEEGKRGGAWPATTTVSVFPPTPNGRRLLWVQALRSDGCADFSGNISALYQLVGSSLVRVSEVNEGALTPGTLLQLAPGQEPHLYYQDDLNTGLLQAEGAFWRSRVRTLSVQNFDCSC